MAGIGVVGAPRGRRARAYEKQDLSRPSGVMAPISLYGPFGGWLPWQLPAHPCPIVIALGVHRCAFIVIDMRVLLPRTKPPPSTPERAPTRKKDYAVPRQHRPPGRSGH